jgi:hypothetical protein
MRSGVMILTLTAALAGPSLLWACPFCGEGGKTLTQSGNEAVLIVSGRLTNANEDKETTDIVIEEVVKDSEVRGKKTTLTLTRFVDLSNSTDKDRFVVFFDYYNDKLDPVKGVATKKGSKLPEYLRGAFKIKDKPNSERLRYFFNHLDSSELTISTDAYWEYANTDYKDFKPMAKGLPADRVAKWLKDPETPSLRLGLYASMLGHCGTEKDAPILRELLDDPDRRQGSGVDGMFAAYVLLKPKDGWKYLQEALKDTKEEFLFRYAALKAVRFLRDYRTEVPKAELESAVCNLLTQEDVADLAIEDLRKWQCWDKADKVLAVTKTNLYKVPIVKRSILRYCLQCQDNKAADAFVTAFRKADPEAVSQAEELLKLELSVQPKKKPADTTKK